MTAQAAAPAFVHARTLAVAVAQAALIVDVELLDRAIAEAERAQAAGPVLDPTLARAAGPELERQVELLRALRTFLGALESFRPAGTRRETPE